MKLGNKKPTRWLVLEIEGDNKMNAIYVFWIRAVIKYLRTPARVIGSLGQPLLFLVALGFGLAPAVNQIGEVSYFSYLVPGIVGLTVLFSAMFSGIELISDRRFGFLRETLVAPVKRSNIFLGMSLGGATISTLQGLLVLFLSMIFGFRLDNFFGFLGGVLIMFFISLLFTMVGLALASKIRDFQSFPLIINFVIFPLFFLSGAIFPLENLPVGLVVVTKLNPLTYGIDLMRYFFIGQSFYSVFVSIIILFFILVFFTLLGGRLFRKLTL